MLRSVRLRSPLLLRLVLLLWVQPHSPEGVTMSRSAQVPHRQGRIQSPLETSVMHCRVTELPSGRGQRPVAGYPWLWA